ncbi:hypothetical protein H1S01_07035 [Heliobacterium chlorum]|uniref:Uncharacterized protein n=1 Tax=Heliobacterium chlorum TaxID=2698 RepID=A0ABR7T0D8_HELCL|nr:hypothetical protein [Heliobacterium chlorum]MBC9784263.1 hypothetical protein [Heliobacterium chlorum]
MVIRDVCYRNVSPHCGRPARIRLRDGTWKTGRIHRVTPQGVVFYSNNPGFGFYPFYAITLLALTLPFFAGYGYGGFGGYGGYGYRGGFLW